MVGEGWNEVSDEGKTFLKELLQVDPKRRLTSEQALCHPWIAEDAPSLNRRLSSISGLAVIASKNKKKMSEGNAPKNADRREATGIRGENAAREVQGETANVDG